MTEEQRKSIALFKYSIISPLLVDSEKFVSNEEFFSVAGEKEYIDPTGKRIIISCGTIKRWYYDYQKKGYEGLFPKRRGDLGHSRKLNDEIIKQVENLIEAYPRLTATSIYKNILSSGIQNKVFSYYTINRVYKQIKQNKANPKITKEMYRYECQYCNEVWCADSSAGPYLYKEGQKIRLWIMAFIDDASRVITGCKIYDSDNTINLINTLKKAVKTYGKPKVLNMDNGKNYRSRQMSIIAAKCGISLHYDPIKTPTSKAKIERFFRTLKEQWMASINYKNFKTIEEYQASLNEYIVKYNNTVHSSLNGNTPFERRNNDLDKIIYIKDEEFENKFMLEVERKVSFDNVVVLDCCEYKTPPKFANRSKMKIKYSCDYSYIAIIDDDGKEYQLELNNKIDNSKIKRSRLTEEN